MQKKIPSQDGHLKVKVIWDDKPNPDLPPVKVLSFSFKKLFSDTMYGFLIYRMVSGLRLFLALWIRPIRT